jgi:hypothetical protein
VVARLALKWVQERFFLDSVEVHKWSNDDVYSVLSTEDLQVEVELGRHKWLGSAEG